MEFISSHLKQKFEEESQKPESKLLRLVLREYDRLTSFLEDLEKYEEEGELIKKEFSDLGSSFSRLVDTAYDNYVGLRSMINTPYEEQTKIENDLIWEKPSNAAGLNKFMRLLKKMNIEISDWIPKKYSKSIFSEKKYISTVGKMMLSNHI